MKKLFLLFILIGISFFSNAQIIRIEGNIMADKEAVSLGQITFYSLPDSTLKKGSYLDSTYFNILFDTNGKEEFYTKISIPNYLDTLINFKVDDSVVNLGVITPLKNTDLNAVDVVYKKEMFKRTIDGISVNVEGTSLQNLTNLFEVLKASPKLTSPDEERIEIIGRGSPLILVDRQAIISNDELKAIPANQIESIEIITNPSAKYKAQGSGNGVIEVYTKNFHLEGYNMTVRAAGGVSTQMLPTAGLSAGLSFKKKKFTLNGYLGANHQQSLNKGSNNGYTLDSTNRETVGEYDYLNKYLWQYFSLKAAYNFNEQSRLTMGINGHGSKGSGESNSSSSYIIEDNVVTNRNSTSFNDWTWLNNSAFINYTLETDTNKSNLEINLNYTNKISNSDNFNRSYFENLPTSTSSFFGIRNDSRDIPNIGELRINYEHVFDTTGWKLGFGGAYSALFNHKRFDQYQDNGSEWIIDPQFSNSYDYQEHIGGFYVELSKSWEKLSFRTGLRTEYTRLDGYSNSLDQQFMDSSYTLPFPSASILYSPVDQVAITAFYDSGIDRPQFTNYDPFVRLTDSLSVSYGNPYLRPAIEQTVGLEVDLFYAYNISVSYSKIKDPTSTVSFIADNSFITESTPMNAKAEERYSASLSVPFQTSWLQGWNSFWLDYTKYSFTDIFQRDDFYNLTYGFYSYLTFTLPKNFELTNRLHINKWGGDQSVNNAMLNWGFRATKKFKGNNFQIFADVGNLFPPKNRSTTYSGNYVYESQSQFNFTTFMLGAFVKFGRLKAPANIQESSSGQSDRI